MWTLNGNPAGNTGTINAMTGRPNVYTVVATDEFGCSETETVTLANFEIQASLNSNEEVLCLGNEIVLDLEIPQSSQDELTIDWIGDDLDVTDPTAPIANPSETTVYEVLITNQEGCTSSQLIEVEVVDIELGLGEALAEPDTCLLYTSDAADE